MKYLSLLRLFCYVSFFSLGNHASAAQVLRHSSCRLDVVVPAHQMLRVGDFDFRYGNLISGQNYNFSNQEFDQIQSLLRDSYYEAFTSSFQTGSRRVSVRLADFLTERGFTVVFCEAVDEPYRPSSPCGVGNPNAYALNITTSRPGYRLNLSLTPESRIYDFEFIQRDFSIYVSMFQPGSTTNEVYTKSSDFDGDGDNLYVRASLLGGSDMVLDMLRAVPASFTPVTFTQSVMSRYQSYFIEDVEYELESLIQNRDFPRCVRTGRTR